MCRCWRTGPWKPPLIVDIVAVAAAVLGDNALSPQAIGVPFGSDASKLTRIGIPAIVLGPGSIDQAHTADEYVPVDELLAAANVYEGIIRQFLTASGNVRLHGAKLNGFRKRSHRIARGNKFMREISFKVQVGDRFCHRAPLQFLRVVQFVTPRHAAGVEVPDVLDVVADGADDVALHDLHVIDVVQQFHARRVHAFHHLHAPGRVVALIILVIYLAVQQFQADCDALVFGNASSRGLGRQCNSPCLPRPAARAGCLKT